MIKKLYIAYGSNLNLNQMKYRCPTAKLVGKGTIENYELQFTFSSNCSDTTNEAAYRKQVHDTFMEILLSNKRLNKR